MRVATLYETIMDKIKKIAGKIDSIHTEPIVLSESFLDFSARFASMSGTAVLMSGGDLDCARFHILGTKPWLTFLGRGNSMTITVQDQTFCFKADPFNTLRMILDSFSLNVPDPPAPVVAGLFGYLSYDLKDSLERLPRTSIDNLCLPHIYLFSPSILVVHDKIYNSTMLCIPERTISGQSNLDSDLAVFKRISTLKQEVEKDFGGDDRGFRSNFTRSSYIDAVRQIKEYIASGDVYQVNLSQRFEMDFQGSGFGLFKALYNTNPAPFFSYINAGSHQVISTSPERFMLRAGKRIEARPIKGTRPRGKTPDEDKRLALELTQSRKDDAELLMIVDLVRNDLGKVCVAGSVRVADHKRIETYRNVYHLVSVVEGIIDRGYDSVDIIKATFPGGSITGCPKIRAMEIIDELEPDRRHIYTGSIGYISFHDTMDMSVAIRTATIYGKKVFFSVGGGIVFDSDPSDEYDETMHKGQTLIETLKGEEKSPDSSGYVWLNGTIKPLDQASIHVADQGFLYGYGFFETIRVDRGKPGYLKEHIARFYQTWKQLFFEEPPDLTWDKIIDQIIVQNSLLEKTAAVKIVATRGDRKEPPLNHTLLVMARLYTDRLAGKKEPGVNLAVYPEPRQTPLADHKTLNYLYYLLAGKWAKEQGAEGALIINPDRTVSETDTANVLLIKDRTVIIPSSPNVLPGIMEGIVCRLLLEWGYKIENRRVLLKDIFSVDQALITNSLMGAVPILSIDRKKLASPSGLWQKINSVVL